MKRQWVLQNVELRNTCASPNIIRVIKSGNMRRQVMQHAWERWEVHTKFWLKNLMEEST